MKPSFLALFALALLAGCQTMTPQERRAADEATCRDFGFRKGTDAFAECLQRIDLDRRAQARANRIAFEASRPPVVVYRPVVVQRR
jgi:hypothetical protein